MLTFNINGKRHRKWIVYATPLFFAVVVFLNYTVYRTYVIIINTPTFTVHIPARVDKLTTQLKTTGAIPATSSKLKIKPQPEHCLYRSFEEILKPCKNSLSWSTRINNTDLKTNLELSYIQTIFNPPGELSFIKITTHDQLNRIKRHGGDSWWVTVNGSVSLQLEMVDGLDGKYEGVFEFIRAGNYTVWVFLRYSLCDGYRDPPEWWFKEGTDHGKFQKQGLLGGQKDLINQVKTFKAVILPSKKIANSPVRLNHEHKNYLNNPCGYWMENGVYITKKRKYLKSKHHRRSGTIWFYGDSLQLRYRDFFNTRPLCTQCFRCAGTYAWIYKSPQLSKNIYDGKEFDQNRTLNEVEQVLNNPSMKDPTSVLLINFGLHMIMSLPMDKLKTFFKSFLTMLKDLKSISPGTFPRIVWRTTTPPLEKEHYKKKNINRKDMHIDQFRFLNQQRVDLWNAFTRDELKNTNIKVLNMFYVAASYAPGTLDGVHYPDAVFESTAEAFEQYVLDE